jgi:hypothetical protein
LDSFPIPFQHPASGQASDFLRIGVAWFIPRF